MRAHAPAVNVAAGNGRGYKYTFPHGGTTPAFLLAAAGASLAAAACASPAHCEADRAEQALDADALVEMLRRALSRVRSVYALPAQPPPPHATGGAPGMGEFDARRPLNAVPIPLLTFFAPPTAAAGGYTVQLAHWAGFGNAVPPIPSTTPTPAAVDAVALLEMLHACALAVVYGGTPLERSDSAAGGLPPGWAA
ncbi:hypothetical protein EON67_03845, partial [archaeon]